MDERLIIRAQGGDEEAFAAIADALVDRFRAISLSMLRRHDLADDATQRALIRVWRDLPALREPDRFEPWSYRILVNACYSEARSLRRWPSLPVDRGLQGYVPPDAIAGIADRDELERAFLRLRTDQRAVLVLHHAAGLSHEEVAAALGIPEGTVRSRLHRARQAMRAALDADARATARPAERRRVPG